MKMHWVTKIAGLLAGVVLSASAMAMPLQNEDFSSGFNNWEGEVEWADGFNGDTIFLPPASFGTYSANYSHNASEKSATLTTTLSNDIAYWSVSLFQSFDMPTTAATLSFSYEWSVTDIAADSVQASLQDPSGALYDLFAALAMQDTGSGSINYDITGFAGNTMALLFLVEDNDEVEGDWLKIRNITITETMSVPAPPVLALLLIGLTGLLYRTKRG